MTEIELRRKVADTALSFLGRKESDGSHREIIDIYNSIKPLPDGFCMKYTDPWCAAFVSAVAWKCGLTKIIFPSASCPRMIELYQKAGRWMENDAYMPQIGDIVFYDWQDSGSGDNVGVADHVGIVVSLAGNNFNVCEGNYSDAVKQRTMQRNGRNIRGFGLPDYASMAGQNTDVPATEIPVVDDDPTPAVSGDTYQLTYTILRYGAGMAGQEHLREQVRSVQLRLRWMGFDIGPDGADGEYGSNTAAAVKAYQRSVGLQADGEFEPLSRARMDGVSA